MQIKSNKTFFFLIRRNFIQEHYANLKKQLPDTPILIREARGIEPKIWARYGKCV